MISKYTIEGRMEQIKLMHELMLSANDENIYMTWIFVMPDEPDEDDFAWFAEDDERYEELCDLFKRLVVKDGLYY